MATTIEKAELLIYNTVNNKKNYNQKVTLDSAMAKYYSSEMAVKVSTDAVQIFGGYGYSKEFPVERFTEILNYVLLVKVLQKFKKWLFQSIF